MSALSKIEILNAVLSRAGADEILSEDDDSTRARLVKAEYKIHLETLTRSHPWRHATAYQSLAQVSPKPAAVYDFGAVFQLPEDCLRVISTSLDQLAPWTEIEGKQIACNASALSAKFIRLIEDTNKFSSNFTQTLIWSIAKDVALPLSASTERAKLCEDQYNKNLEVARSFDAQVGMLDRVSAPVFNRGRRY